MFLFFVRVIASILVLFLAWELSQFITLLLIAASDIVVLLGVLGIVIGANLFALALWGLWRPRNQKRVQS